jgi:hypothetical protein
MDGLFYSLAFGGSEVAPVQLAHSLRSIRFFSPDLPVFVYLFGEAPAGFVDVLRKLNAEVRHLGEHRAYIARTQPERAEFFALDPKIHRWLVLDEPELKRCSRILYIDSDTFFFAPPSRLFERYRGADLYAREEPFSRRSILGYNPSYLDENAIAQLRQGDKLRPVPPFNTGVCLFTREMADSITSIVPAYFDYLFRFFAWFRLHPDPRTPALTNAEQLVHDRFLRDAAAQALPYPSQNRWIVDQVALWLALGRFPEPEFADFAPSDVWQGGEFQQMSPSTPPPILCHYFGSNMQRFFGRLRQLQQGSART